MHRHAMKTNFRNKQILVKIMLLNIDNQDKWNLSLPYSIFPASGTMFIIVLVTKSSPTLWSTGFPRQKYWSQLPFPFPGDLPDPGIEPPSFMSPVLADGFFTSESPEKLQWCCVLRTKFHLGHCFNGVYPGCSLIPSLTTLKTTGSQGNVQGKKSNE